MLYFPILRQCHRIQTSWRVPIMDSGGSVIRTSSAFSPAFSRILPDDFHDAVMGVSSQEGAVDGNRLMSKEEQLRRIPPSIAKLKRCLRQLTAEPILVLAVIFGQRSVLHPKERIHVIIVRLVSLVSLISLVRLIILRALVVRPLVAVLHLIL